MSIASTKTRPLAPKSVPAGEGKKHCLLGAENTDKLNSQDTGGLFHFSEVLVQPGGGPPPHVHSREDELFYILEGEMDLEVAGQRVTGGPGTLAYLPRGVAHRFGNSSTAPARMLGLITPPEFAGFLRQAAKLADRPDFHPSRLSGLADEYGVSFGAESASIGPDGRTPVVSVAGDGECVSVDGADAVVKLTAAQTAGALGAYDLIVPPAGSPAAHVHDGCDELFYVLDGEFVFRVDGTDLYTRTGSTVFVPRGAVHQFRNVGVSAGRLYSVVTPGGSEGAFAPFHAANSAGTITPDEARHIGAEFQTRYCLGTPQLSRLTLDAISNLRHVVAGTSHRS